MLDIAGVTVGAAFVGTIVSTFVIGDILRLLHGGQNYSVITLDLRSPAGIQTPRADCDDSPPATTVHPGTVATPVARSRGSRADVTASAVSSTNRGAARASAFTILCPQTGTTASATEGWGL